MLCKEEWESPISEDGPLHDIQIILIYFISYRLLFYFRGKHQIEMIKNLVAEASV